MIRQLDVPLRTLAPNRRVYIVRNGLVYQYPARIVRDMANDMWVGPEDDTFEPIAVDYDYGNSTADAYYRGTPRNSLPSLLLSVWRCFASPHEFADWLDNTIPSNVAIPPDELGVACAYAARNVMTWSLFVHRNEVDTSGLGA